MKHPLWTRHRERTVTMPVIDFLERNVKLYGNETALVELNPEIKETRRMTWKEYDLIQPTTDSHSWSWTYDSSKDGIIKVTRNFYDLKYPENNGTSSYIVKWE